MPPRARKTVAVKDESPKVLVLDRKENVEKFSEREPLFSVDGVEYTIPKNIPASLTISALDALQKVGAAAATDIAMKEMLGEDGYSALTGCKTLSRDDLNAVVKIILEKVIPQDVVGPKAESTENK